MFWEDFWPNDFSRPFKKDLSLGSVGKPSITLDERKDLKPKDDLEMVTFGARAALSDQAFVRDRAIIDFIRETNQKLSPRSRERFIKTKVFAFNVDEYRVTATFLRIMMPVREGGAMSEDTNSSLQLSFNSRLKRARLEFRVDECFKSRKPPRELIARLEDRLKEERNEGFIETYLIFHKRLEEFWSHIRSLEGEIDGDKMVKFTLAQGGRIYSEIQIETSKSLGTATLSCKIPPKKMSSISFNAFLFNVMLQLDQEDLPLSVDRGQMRFLYLMLKNGQALDGVKIVSQPKADEVSSAGYMVRINPQLHYATLHVFDSRWLADELTCKKLLKEARIALKKINVKNIKMNFLEGHSIEKISSLLTKAQAFGFSMPYDLLVAYDEQYRLNANLLASDKAVAEVDLQNLTASKAKHRRLRSDCLHFELDPSAMKASVIAVDEKIDKVRNAIDDKWLIAELAKAGINYGFEATLPDFVDALRRGDTIVGAQIAKGKAAEPGENLAFVPLANADSDYDDTVDLRERQNHKVVHKDDLVGEVRYTDGQAGMTVEGKFFFARGSAISLGLQTGDGIICKHDCQFFAVRDGLLSIENNIISCKTVYVHKGSINLASGNLKFEGSVVVEGDIESGATVEIVGTLLVKGSIDSAKVRCSGDVEVKGGVNTGKRGFLHVGGSATVGFIENSIIQVKESLTVQRLITHSWVVSGGVIEVRDESKGMILGGLVCSWQSIVCAKFGGDKGHTTQCRIGSNYQDELRLQRLSQRIKRFQEASNENLSSIELLEKPGRQLSEDQMKHLEYIRRNAGRYESILTKLKETKAALDQAIVYNPDATLVVTDIIDKNSMVYVSGKKITVPTNLKGVLLSAAVPKGILDLSGIESFQRSHPNAVVALR
jgi:uncharacterized protein (DUF342 family)